MARSQMRASLKRDSAQEATSLKGDFVEALKEGRKEGSPWLDTSDKCPIESSQDEHQETHHP